jgi:1,4-dihydroxy-2-naphthoyl-CoA hydrolase
MSKTKSIDISTLATLDQINAMNKNTIMEALDIKYTEMGVNYICGTMPVGPKTHQPVGLLHGGASCVLAESLGSLGSALIADARKNNVTGLEINANHIKAKTDGIVSGKASLIHYGRTTHIWQIEITDEEGALVCISRLTVLIVPKQI